MARLAGLLVASLGIREVALAVGGSLGGMVALEYALLHPGGARVVAALAAPAAHTALAIAWNHLQRELVARWGVEGLSLARQVAMLSFRTEAEFEQRFGRRAAEDGTFEMRRYLDRHGAKLVARFDPATYATLLDAMDAHDLGRGRGGLALALGALREAAGRVIAVGVAGDLLYSADVVRGWAALAGADYHEIHSVHGHDAFLLEAEQVGAMLGAALVRASEPGPAARAGPGGAALAADRIDVRSAARV
jgi:homoserine O-acetyltransferase